VERIVLVEIPCKILLVLGSGGSVSRRHLQSLQPQLEKSERGAERSWPAWHIAAQLSHTL